MQLTSNGWEGRCAAVVIDPELENWLGICASSSALQKVIGWPYHGKDFHQYLQERGALHPGVRKLHEPKEAFQNALEMAGVPRSSALYHDLAKRVRLESCVDPAFHRLISTLRNWFPSSH